MGRREGALAVIHFLLETGLCLNLGLSAKLVVPSIQLRVAALHQAVPRRPEIKEKEEEEASHSRLDRVVGLGVDKR